MKNIRIFTMAFLAFIISSSSLLAQDAFISATDFMKLYKNKNTVVVSAQKEKNYKLSHIRNSVFFNHKDLYDKSKAEGVLQSPAAMAKLFAAKGISDKNTIIVYDDGKNKAASRLYWVLKYLGAPNVKILHKDMGAWRKARVPITKTPSKAKKATFTAKVNGSIFINMSKLKANMSKYKVVDARGDKEFKGTSDKSKGHISGAVNIEWSKVENDKGGLKSAAEIAKVFSSKGITKSSTVVVYCGTGVRAAVLYVALKKANYKNVLLYDGSYNEWVAKGGKVVK